MCAEMNAKSHQFHATFAQMWCICAFAMARKTQGSPAVGIGHFVRHCRAVPPQKGAIYFRRYPDSNGFKILKIFCTILTL